MKPAPFSYRAPTSVAEAVELLAEHGDDAKVLAGGQSLVPLLALRLARPALLVDIGRIAELRSVEVNGSLRLGAAATQRSLERSATVAAAAPLLGSALPLIAHPAIRSRGTIGGSLAHADPAAELPAVAVALDADLTVRSRSGERRVKAGEFFAGYFTTALQPDELLVEVGIPRAVPGSGHAFEEISRRHGDFALVGCAAALQLADDGTVASARLVYSGVAATPQRVSEAEQALVGATPGPEAFAAAAAAAVAALRPGSDLHASAAYRRHVAGVLTGRALAAACDAARATTATTARTGGAA